MIKRIKSWVKCVPQEQKEFKSVNFMKFECPKTNSASDCVNILSIYNLLLMNYVLKNNEVNICTADLLLQKIKVNLQWRDELLNKKHLDKSTHYISFNIKPCLNKKFTETISNNNTITNRLLSSKGKIT